MQHLTVVGEQHCLQLPPPDRCAPSSQPCTVDSFVCVCVCVCVCLCVCVCCVQFSVSFSSWLPHVNTLDSNDFVQLTFANIMKYPTTFICQQLAGDLQQRSQLVVQA